MTLARGLIYSDFLLILMAFLLPSWFVAGSYELLSATGLNSFNLTNSYAAIVMLCSMAASLLRRQARGTPNGGDYVKSRLLLGLLVACVACYLIWELREVDQASVGEVISPYFSYFFSVIFNAGAGYALAGLIFGLFTFNRSMR